MSESSENTKWNRNLHEFSWQCLRVAVTKPYLTEQMSNIIVAPLNIYKVLCTMLLGGDKNTIESIKDYIYRATYLKINLDAYKSDFNFWSELDFELNDPKIDKDYGPVKPIDKHDPPYKQFDYLDYVSGVSEEFQDIAISSNLYFKTEYVHEFHSKNNVFIKFHYDMLRFSLMDFMVTSGDYDYYEDKELDMKIVAIELKNQDYKMIFGVANKSQGIDDIMKVMTGEKMEKMLNSMQRVHIKKFIMPLIGTAGGCTVELRVPKVGIIELFSEQKWNKLEIPKRIDRYMLTYRYRTSFDMSYKDISMKGEATDSVQTFHYLNQMPNLPEVDKVLINQPWLACIYHWNDKIPVIVSKMGSP